LWAKPGEALDLLYLPDTSTRYNEPQVERAFCEILCAMGLRARSLPLTGASRVLISKGYLDQAKRHAARLARAIEKLDPDGCLPVVGLEPSEILTLRDEYPAIFPGDPAIARLADQAWMADEFLVRQERAWRRVSLRNEKPVHVWLHGHCHQKAVPPEADGEPAGVQATVEMLRRAGCQVTLMETGCCGMAGAFGYESEHYSLSMQIGELALLPQVRQAPGEAQVCASGASCRAQIAQGTGRKTLHPIEVVRGVVCN
jgi:Fe-S oxidoreductase